MKFNRLILLLLVVGALSVPAVSADDHTIGMLPFSDEKNMQVFDYSTVTFSKSTSNEYTRGIAIIGLSKVQFYSNVHYFMWETPSDFSFTEGDSYVWYSRPSDNAYKKATFKVIKTRNMLGQVTKTVAYLFPLEWAVGTKTGAWSSHLYVDNNGVKGGELFVSESYTPAISNKWSPVYESGNSDYIGYMYITAIRTTSTPSGFSQHSRAEGYTNIRYAIDIEESGSSYIVELTRIINGIPSPSTIKAIDSDDVVVYEDSASVNREFLVGKDILKTLEIITGTITNTYILNAGDAPTPEDSSTLNLYVRSSQTNALIADARAVIEAGFNDPADLLIVSNTTLPSGTKTYTLQPTGGGLPNPDYYRVTVTADGYNAEMPYADITLDAGMSMTMVMGMEPTGGAPEDPGYTYIDVYVRDINANPISDATVKLGGYTLKTNSAGYTLFDVPVNSTYTYTVKKTGYTSIEGSVTVADAARYPVNIVMGTGVIPTNTPTAEPTGPGATPTVPAGEETPGPGFVDQSAKNFATFLGVSYAVGRAALGMLIATAIGFTTARKLKGGAPEFGIGFIAGAALMVLITLLPAWIFIVMVIIVAGLLGYKYMSGGS